MEYLTNPTPNRFVFKTVTDGEVLKIINSIKPKNSCGHDNLSGYLLKLIKMDVCKAITLVINQMITTGIFPDVLKIAKVLPVYKKNDASIFDNYRPISILPAISKIFERVIFNQTHQYFNEKQLYYDSQYGFRKSHSTELASYELVDRIISQMENSEIPLNIYMDLSKAFDTLDHDILLRKLSYYGIKGNALTLFSSYLSDRKQYVIMDDIKSQYLDITTGVPQGSILGPLLFIIYINDITSASTLFKFIIYADDTTLSSTLSIFKDQNNNEVNSLNINRELNNINIWLKVNKLSLNINKTKFMLFYTPQKQVAIPSLEIDAVKLDCVDEFNFLGLVLDKHMNWNKHLQKVSSKVSQIVGIMSKIKTYLPKETLLTIYNSLILPHINYCLLAWGHKFDRLAGVQKKAVRLINSSKYNAHTEPIFKLLKLLKIEDIYKLQLLKFYYKLKHNKLPKFFNNLPLFQGSLIHNYNTRGRNKIFVTHVHHTFSKQCIRYELIHILNETPEIVKDKVNTHSIQGFSVYLKQYYIKNYETDCHIPNCYICNG